MSNLLEQASLVLIPSGYKEDIVYSEIPLDGSGDLQLTRASNGTRINSAGLVEVVPWNLIQQSETIGVSPWAIQNCSVTGNTTTAPNGTTTAETLTEDTSTSRKLLYQNPTIVANQEITLTIYVKANTLQYIRLVSNDLAENFRWFGAQFNLTALTYTSATGSNGNATFTSASITDAGNGWYRISVSGTINATTLVFAIFTSNGTAFSSSDDRGGNVYLGTGKTAFIWGAQLNIGSTAKPYFPTTDRLNVPRLTYQNGGGGCPSLLLEKQSTNQYPYSEDLTQWTTSGSPTVTGNDSTSPDGTTNADRVQFNASGNLLYISGTGSAGANILTVYAKAKSGTAQKFRFFANGATLISSDFTATDQWQRFEFSYTYSAQTAGLQGASTGASDVLFWGFQHEVSSYPTSYIPTTSASATRVADACSKTGISSLIGQTEGVIFYDFNYVELDSNGLIPITIIQNSSNHAYFYIDGNNAISFDFIYAGADVVNISTSTGFAVKGQRYKIAFAYKQNDFAVYINGVQIGTDTSGLIPSFSELNLGYPYASGYNYPNVINALSLFKTRLTNAELASLTTL